MLKAIQNALRIPDLRKKIGITVAILALYRLGAYLPVPGIPFRDMLDAYQNAASGSGALTVLNLFSGGALSRVSVFSLGIMPYITAQIILQMMQAVIPSLGELAREGEAGQRKITQYTRYLTVALSLISAVGYLFLFKSAAYGMSFDGMGIPAVLEDAIVIVTLVAGALIIMWLGEVITQRGIGNGMSLIIFANIMAGLPSAIISSVMTSGGVLVTILTLVVIVAIIPVIVYIERGQRRIPVQYAKRVVGRQMMGGQSTYLPIKVNTAGVVPIIFASALLYLPAQIAVFFPTVGWMQTFANAVSSGWVNWVLSVLLIVFFAYFYTAMVFNPDETADQLKKSGGFIPGIRPGKATADYIKAVLDHVTMPGAIFMAVLAVAPSIIFSFTNNSLIQSFGGTSILIMVGVAMDTLASLESQLKMHDYEGFFK
ncbi:MAG: preprotein translocase subunit SecY [Olegusella sp.]|nr:preprotein translocase subunit SecY [Olegusella sp.]